MQKLKSFIERVKSDPVLKNKLIRAAIFFVIFAAVATAYFVMQSGSEQKVPLTQEQQNKIMGRIIPADTTSMSSNKQDIFSQRSGDSLIIQQATASNVLGGSVVQQHEQQQQTDNMLGNYMAERQRSIDRMQNSGTTTTVAATGGTPHRRSYNPSGRSQDWTSQPTTVTGTRITSDQPVISSYQRNYNPDNPSASLSTNLTSQNLAPQPVQQAESRPLTKEEKLQQAISQKYGSSGQGGYQGISVSGMIYQNQKIDGNNNSVRILLMEKLNLGNVTIGTDAFVFGMASNSGNSVLITIPTISYKGKSYQVNLEVFDARTGERGIPVKTDNIVGDIERQAQNEAVSEISKYAGRIGQIASSVIGNRSRSKTNAVTLNQGHRVFLKSRN